MNDQFAWQGKELQRRPGILQYEWTELGTQQCYSSSMKPRPRISAWVCATGTRAACSAKGDAEREGEREREYEAEAFGWDNDKTGRPSTSTEPPARLHRVYVLVRSTCLQSCSSQSPQNQRAALPLGERALSKGRATRRRALACIYCIW